MKSIKTDYCTAFSVKIGLLSIRELFTNLIAALKNPVLECCNSELPGTALNVAD